MTEELSNYPAFPFHTVKDVRKSYAKHGIKPTKGRLRMLFLPTYPKHEGVVAEIGCCILGLAAVETGQNVHDMHFSDIDFEAHEGTPIAEAFDYGRNTAKTYAGPRHLLDIARLAYRCNKAFFKDTQ